VCENVVAIGTRKKELVCSELEYRIKEGLDKVNWVSCSIKKTTLIIDIYDTADGSEVQEDGSTGDIISDTDCIITDIIPVSGTPLVSVGDKVKKGDVLISGEVTIYNDYGEEVDTAIVAAKGYVTGEITENYSDTIEYERQEKLYDTGFKSFSLGYGDTGADILTPKITQPYDVDIEQKRLSLGESCYLPFYITTYNVHPYSVVSVTNTEQQLKEIMSKRIEAYVSGLQKKGVEIVENNVKIYIDEKGCHAKGNIKYKKTIGYKGD
jgi:similar to stage IV sporulation protein